MGVESASKDHGFDSPTAGRDPYLRLHSVDVFIRDYERSLRFYIDLLGFELAFDVRLQSGERCVGVAPHDGTAVLTLIQPEPDSPNNNLIGRPTRVMFVTEDIARTYVEWSARGVRFRHTPKLRRVKYQKHEKTGVRHADPLVAHGDQAPVWGQVFTRFEDIDGNVFSLVSFDEVSKALEAQRRAAEEKREAERRLAHELDIARRVQARLFPQAHPPCSTLVYAGKCDQARQVGGDYFDFFSLGEKRVAMVVSDIAGKGIAAALLMANLQANLRSQCLTAVSDPERFLRSVNHLFFENTAASAYATLFFADYSDSEQRLRYVNCGHLSGLLLRSDDHVEWLPSTCTVLGLFAAWECSIAECTLAKGDTLVIYTDGVTEACDDSGDEFGQSRLLSSAKTHRHLTPHHMIDAILADVRRFSVHEQLDDMTLLVAKSTTVG
jgi:serine phosphatase RsbU (regulator of sigma subunit)/catechol 2,3-dioxygenase-like lactoylglutathione lyase family enzyme